MNRETCTCVRGEDQKQWLKVMPSGGGGEGGGQGLSFCIIISFYDYLVSKVIFSFGKIKN